MREVLFIAFVLACPLMMIFMMRGGHGHGGGRHGQPREISTDELRRQRAELDRLIDDREGSERHEPDHELTSWRGGRR